MGAIKTDTATATETVTSTEPMSVRAPLAELKAATALLARVADKKSSMPILAHALVRVSASGTLLAATDLNLSIIVRMPWSGANGGYCVPAKQLADTVKRLPGDACDISRKGHALALSCGSIASLVCGIPDRDFPKVPNDEADDLAWHETDAKALANALGSVAYAVCKDETRFHLNGVYLQSTGSDITAVSTDGHRLTLARATFATAPTKGVIIPDKSVREIVKLLSDRKRKDAACKVAIKGNQLFVRHGEVTLVTKLIDAQFPPYEQVIPKDYTRLCTVERKPLIEALKRAAVVCTETRGVKLAFATGKLTLVSDHPELGEQREDLTDDSGWTTGKACDAIGANVRYLLDALGEIDCERVTLAFSAELDPILVRSTHDSVEHSIATSPHLAVIMPMRI